MKTEIKILKFLLEVEKNPTIRGISRGINADYKITNTAVNKLAEKKLIDKKILGKAHEIILARKLSLEIFEAEFERRETKLKNSNLRVLYDKLNSLPFSFTALLFGSFVKSGFSRNSDIDLMIISEKEHEKNINSAVSLLPLKIHLIFLTYEEFLDMANSKKFSVVSEAIKKNIILIGAEDYYRLMQNVGQK